MVSACAVTEKPKQDIKVRTEIVSYSNNSQNGGIIDFKKGIGWIVTASAAEKYEKLVKLYGDMFLPALKSNEIQPFENNFILTQEQMIKFARMNQRWKLERK